MPLAVSGAFLAMAIGACSAGGDAVDGSTTTAQPFAPILSTSAGSEPMVVAIPSTTSAPLPDPDPVLIGAGDIATSDPEDSATAALIEAFPEAIVFTTGDNAYPDGTAEEFAEYYDTAWGSFKARTRPAIGNHDAHTEGAGPYFDYFGTNAGTPGQGWYAYDLENWHVIVLNSECDESGFASCDDQTAWLTSDLSANTESCMLAYWHKPVFNSGRHDSEGSFADEWALLDAAGVDFVMNGHDHNYQRYAPQDSDGTATTSGMREFVVGSGGAELYDQETSLPNLEAFYSGYGVLKLDLGEDGYSWTFISTDGSYTDTGTGTCTDG